MGMNSEGVDTGFVNTSAFTLLGEGSPLVLLGMHLVMIYLLTQGMLGC